MIIEIDEKLTSEELIGLEIPNGKDLITYDGLRRIAIRPVLPKRIQILKLASKNAEKNVAKGSVTSYGRIDIMDQVKMDIDEVTELQNNPTKCA